MKIKRWLKAYFSKLNFYSGRNPIIIKSVSNRFIPSGYETVLLISADFELAWASRYGKNKHDTLEDAINKAKSERKNIPLILNLSDEYKIPLTWATIGHLFLKSCSEKSGKKHPEIFEVPHYEGSYWDYIGTDWFKHDPCTDYKKNPEWYAPDLINMIKNSAIEHEIGCHTFSHIDCRNNICPEELIRSELHECKKLAAETGITLRSFVHPGHSIGNLDILAEEGFTNFRSNNRNVLGFPVKHSNGLWEFEQTTELVYKTEWSVNYHIFRYKEIMKRAIKSKTICVLWFHPSFDSHVVDEILPALFKYVSENREKILVTTHGKYIEWLNGSEL